MPFKSELEGRFLGDDRWQLTKPLIYETLLGDTIIVPEKFTSDAASIPRFFWRIIGGPWSGKYGHAAVLHDFMCLAKEVPRKRADIVFYESMKESGVPYWKRKIMYFAVKVASYF